jgi:hypothetical protein
MPGSVRLRILSVQRAQELGSVRTRILLVQRTQELARLCRASVPPALELELPLTLELPLALEQPLEQVASVGSQHLEGLHQGNFQVEVPAQFPALALHWTQELKLESLGQMRCPSDEVLARVAVIPKVPLWTVADLKLGRQEKELVEVWAPYSLLDPEVWVLHLVLMAGHLKVLPTSHLLLQVWLLEMFQIPSNLAIHCQSCCRIR